MKKNSCKPIVKTRLHKVRYSLLFQTISLHRALGIPTGFSGKLFFTDQSPVGQISSRSFPLLFIPPLPIKSDALLQLNYKKQLATSLLFGETPPKRGRD